MSAGRCYPREISWRYVNVGIPYYSLVRCYVYLFKFIIDKGYTILLTNKCLNCFRFSWTFLSLCVSQEIQRGCINSLVPVKSKVLHTTTTFRKH